MNEHHRPRAVEPPVMPQAPDPAGTGRRGRVRALLALGTVVGIGVLGTSATFSDSATVTADFTAGTLDITVDGEEGRPTPYVLAFPGADAIAPGQTVFAPLQVANVGTVDAELSMSVDPTPDGTATNATDDLEMSVVHTTGTACDAGVVSADPAPYSAAGPLADATMSGVQLDGGSALDLCLAVTLPVEVTGTGGGGVDVELAFLAEQRTV